LVAIFQFNIGGFEVDIFAIESLADHCQFLDQSCEHGIVQSLFGEQIVDVDAVSLSDPVCAVFSLDHDLRRPMHLGKHNKVGFGQSQPCVGGCQAKHGCPALLVHLVCLHELVSLIVHSAAVELKFLVFNLIIMYSIASSTGV